MAMVRFTENIQRHVSCPEAEATGATVREVLDKVFASNENARSYILDDQGRLRKHMMIFLNGKLIQDRDTLSDMVADSGKIDVMQALSGG